MLTWLVNTAAWPWLFNSLGLIPNPTRNMKMITPIWLKALRKPRLAGGNKYAESPGAIQPSSDGPSRMPANISPTTRG